MSHKTLNTVFAAHVIFFALVISGLIPRSLVVYETIALAAYLLAASIRDGLIFFVRSIPIFLAIPLTSTFDNFNMWRIFAAILFLKWLILPETLGYLKDQGAALVKKPLTFAKTHPVLIVLALLLLLSIASLYQAPDQTAGIKRIIYFINASIVGIVIWHEARAKEFAQRVIKNITIPVIMVTIAGAVQLLATYTIDIYQFMRVWGEGVQMRQFGSMWSYIATHVGNTWFAYYGDQLSLRVFSLFPDSHSFPIFLLLGLPAFFAWTLLKPLEQSTLKNMILTRGKMAVLWVPLIFLFTILSGTRGIWAAAIAMVLWILIVLGFMRHTRESQTIKNIFKYLATYLVVFFVLFTIAFPIFSSPQFLVSKGDTLLLQKRLTSILDIGETSNSQRIDIWKRSLNSIKRHPATGVGIGNFPIVLDQEIRLTRAGSSAHNIYLHVAAEMGLIALAALLGFCLLILVNIYKRFTHVEGMSSRAYFGGLLITVPWIMAYLMTDIALFDERALLMFAVTLGLIFSHDRK